MIVGITNIMYTIWLVIVLGRQKDTLGYYLRSWMYRLLSDTLIIISLISGYIKKNESKIENYPNRKGMKAVITEGKRGVSLLVIKGLVRCGMHVIVGVRHTEQCEELRKEIQGDGGCVEFITLDTSSLASVKTFAERVMTKYKEVNLLINNASIANVPHKLSHDGFESQLAANYIGHFYLTHLLMNNMKTAGKNGNICSRVVNIISCTHSITKINFKDISLTQEYHKSVGYAQSKLALLMFSRYLNRYMEALQFPIRSYAVHPGVLLTEKNLDFKSTTLVTPFMKFMTNPEVAALRVLQVCLSSRFEETGGQFISDLSGYFSRNHSQDVTQQEKLFNFTNGLLNIKRFGKTDED